MILLLNRNTNRLLGGTTFKEKGPNERSEELSRL